MSTLPTPDPFLEVRVQELDGIRGVFGLCAGFEKGKWRYKELADHLIEWLPEFALDWADIVSIGPQNMMARAKKAAKSFYQSNKYQNRGEIGELLLHAVIRQTFQTLPAISKLYYKDAPNDTVKGFDAVHVVATDESLELWTGEVKLYTNITQAVYDVSKELTDHLEDEYLRNEFIAINNKISDGWPHVDRLKKLLHRNTSLDEVFDALCIPVLLCYESKLFSNHKLVSKEFKDAFAEEAKLIRQAFDEKK